MTAHEQAAAALVGGVLLVFSAVAAGVGRVLGAQIDAAAIGAGAIFLGGVLVSVLGWMAVNLNRVSTDTAVLREQMSDTRDDVGELKRDVNNLKDRRI